MKSALILGTTFATAFAGNHERQLTNVAWNPQDIAGSTAGATGKICVFKDTDFLFAHKWGMLAWSHGSGHTDEDDLTDHGHGWNQDEHGTDDDDSGNNANSNGFAEGGEYDSNLLSKLTNTGTATRDAWTTDSIVLARFAVDLTLTNYASLVTDAATKNYKFFEHNTDDCTTPGGSDHEDCWRDWNGDMAGYPGREAMTRICVYKNKDDNCEAGDITIEVSDGGDLGDGVSTPTPSKQVNIGLRKILGVATTCGDSVDGGDREQLTSGADDIFVWSNLEAEAEFQFTLTYLVSGDNNEDHIAPLDSSNTYDTDALAPSGDTDSADTFITYTLDVRAPEPATHDLLFIHAPVINTVETIFTSHPGGQGAGADTRYRVDYHGEVETTGGIAITGADGTQECGLTLTVKSQTNGHWHCFRDANAKTIPTSDSTEWSDEDGNAALTTLATTLNPDDNGNAACTAQIEVKCSSALEMVSGTDTRECKYNSYGTEADAITKRAKDFKECQDASWFIETPSYYVNENVLNGHYETAIIQAVRLTDTRRYPHGADTLTASGGASTEQIKDTFGGDETTVWECGDDNQCATEDPYVILDYNKVTASIDFAGIGPFTTDISRNSCWDGTDPTTATATQAATMEAACADQGAQGQGDHIAVCSGGDHASVVDRETSHCYRQDIPTFTCSGNTNDGAADYGCTQWTDTADTTVPKPAADNDGPSYKSTEVALINPPDIFPEAYVFGVANFRFTTAGSSNPTYQQDIVTPTQGNQPTAPIPTRRLRAAAAEPESNLVQRTLMVNAVQDVISK